VERLIFGQRSLKDDGMTEFCFDTDTAVYVRLLLMHLEVYLGNGLPEVFAL
jgi:hypothetical protein